MSKQNGQRPASPVAGHVIDDYGLDAEARRSGARVVVESHGMTKRETIAMHLMAGLLASEVEASESTFARKAVDCADALLEALE